MKPLRLGIIGCGIIGTAHVKAASACDRISLVAVADLRQEAAQKAASEFGVQKVYTNAEALLADDQVEAVVLALPACARIDLVGKAFVQGKHVLTEKPVGLCATDVEKMLELQGNCIGACCSSRFRFLEHARAATDFLSRGALGPLRLLRCRGVQTAGKRPAKPPPAWRLKREINGGGILANWGCYDLDYLLGLTGWSLKPQTVFAQTWTVPQRLLSHVAPGADAETHVAALIRCDGGTVISIERGEYLPAPREHVWQIIGENGSLGLNMTPATGKKILHFEADTEKGVIEKTLWEGDDEVNIMLHLHEDFAAAVQENRPPRTSLEQALVVQKITDAIYASAQAGEAVKIS